MVAQRTLRRLRDGRGAFPQHSIAVAIDRHAPTTRANRSFCPPSLVGSRSPRGSRGIFGGNPQLRSARRSGGCPPARRTVGRSRCLRRPIPSRCRTFGGAAKWRHGCPGATGSRADRLIRDWPGLVSQYPGPTQRVSAAPTPPPPTGQGGFSLPLARHSASEPASERKNPAHHRITRGRYRDPAETSRRNPSRYSPVS